MWLIFVALLGAFMFVLDSSFWRDLTLLGFVIVFPIPISFVMSRESKGKILLDHEGLTLRSSRTFRCAWADVAQMFVTSISVRSATVVWLCGVAGFDVHKPFIEVRIRRSLRYNPVTEDQSTRGWGIPIAVHKRFHLYADDPYELIAVAQVHLQPGVHA